MLTHDVRRLVWQCLQSAIAVLVAGSMSSATTDDELDADSKAFVTETVNLLSDCSGFYEFVARSFEQEQKPASAEQLRGYARGARMSAAYLLSLEAAAGGKRRQIGSFLTYVDGRAETNRNRLAALLEQHNSAGLDQERTRCIEALPMQDELVQRMRNDAVDRD